MVTSHANLKQVEIVAKSLSFADDSFTLLIEISTQRIFDSLQSNPLLLAVFAVETIVNKYSLDVSHYINRCIDLTVPGTLSNKYWRHYFTGEVPFPSFAVQESSLFRGSIYNCYRFISGVYFYVQMFENASGDLKIELKKPQDGRFWANKYNGHTIVCEIKRDEIVAFIAKVSVFPTLVGEDYVSNLNLLHGDNLMDLLTTILDTLHINIQYERSVLEADEELDWQLTVPIKIDGIEKFIQIDVTKLKEKIQKIFSNFNLWVSENRALGHVAAVSGDNLKALEQWVSDMVEESPQWCIRTEKDVNNRQVVPVFTALSPPFIDLEKFAGVVRQRESNDNWMRKHDDGSISYSVNQHISTFHIHMDVTVHTNTDKSVIYVEVVKADENHNIFRTVLEEQEYKLMFEEDRASLEIRHFLKRKAAISSQERLLRSLQDKSFGIISKLKYLEAEEKRLKYVMRRAVQKVLAFVDLVFDKSARRSLKLLESNIARDEATSKFFLVGNVPETLENLRQPTAQLSGASCSQFESEVNRFLQWTENAVSIAKEFVNSPCNNNYDIIMSTVLQKRGRRKLRRMDQNALLGGTISYTTSSIPKHTPRISNRLFFSNRTENPTGFRLQTHWHRERFQRVFFVNKYSSFKTAHFERLSAGKRLASGKLMRISGKLYSLRFLKVFDYGVSSFVLFEIDTLRSYSVSGIDRRTTDLFDRYFLTQGEGVEKQSDNQKEIVSDRVNNNNSPLLNVMARNVVFKAVVSAYLKASETLLGKRIRDRITNHSQTLSNFFAARNDAEDCLNELIHSNNAELVDKVYSKVLTKRTAVAQVDRKELTLLAPMAPSFDMIGIFIPQDQSLGIDVVKVSAVEWKRKCWEYLRFGEKIRRGMALLGMIYHVEDPPFGSYSSKDSKSIKLYEYFISDSL